MGYSILSSLFAWTMPTKEDRKQFRALCQNIDNRKEIIKIHHNYANLIKKLRNKDKYKVLFLVSENSKWKAQSLYDLMAKSDKFEPIIALTVLKDVHRGNDITRNNIDEDYNYFKNKGMQVVLTYKNKQFLDLKAFNPDIVFYQQPWGINKLQSPKRVSKYALTYYIPYYVNNYELQPIEYEQEFHKSVYKYFVLNKWWEEEYKRISSLSNVVGLGNPILDNFIQNNNNENSKGYVIYAPHYSFFHELNQNPVNYGTFQQNGNAILEYAKQHKEFNWVFKPHPQLKYALLKTGYSYKDIEAYYEEWEKLGTVCYDSSYIELFKNSKLLITDCDSFLLEYFCTTNPIIHLISSKCTINASNFSKDIFETFYKAKTNEELFNFINEILVKNNDYQKEKRIKLLESSKLLKNNSATNIINDICSDIKKIT